MKGLLRSFKGEGILLRWSAGGIERFLGGVRVIRVLNREDGPVVLEGGSDCRADGMAIPV
jgi:hypothetical protein